MSACSVAIGCYSLSLDQTWKITHVGAENVMDLQLNQTTNEEKNWDEKNEQLPDQNISCTKTS